MLIALEQSCRTNSTLEPPNPEAEKAQSTANGDTTAKSELTEAEQQSKKVPQPSMEPARRESLPESTLVAPEKDLASASIKYDTVVRERQSDTPIHSEWQYRQGQQNQIVGFEFSNRGGNRILPHRYDIQKNLLFTRDFIFRFDDRARQDIHLFVSDWAPSRDRQFRLSELMNSVMLFFPRNYLPAIVRLDGRTIVTLPTGEEVEFDTKTHEVLGGVFSEAPVDLNPDKVARKFPGIAYIGKGVVVRADSRGMDPRIGTTAMVSTGSPASDCEKGTDCNRCQVPSKELWNQNRALRFKFSTDEEFDRYLISRCGFGIPKDGPFFMIRSPLKVVDK